MEALTPITIVAICDNHYLPMFAALIKSIEVNHHTGEKLKVYIVEDGVSEKSKSKLQRSINADMTTLHWVKMKEAVPKGIKLPLDYTTYPLTIYIRLFIPYFISPEIDKVIFVDVDMIVQKDISLLWNVELNDYVVAAVQDPRIKVVSNSWGGILNYEELGLSADTKYFNTGLLVFNVKEWTKQNITEKVVDVINKNIKVVNYPDQYGLNVVLANKWVQLGPKWNHFASDEDPNPYLIHFIGRKPIYKAYNYSEEYKSIFYKYLKLTEWRDFKAIGETRRYFKKLMNIVEKIKIFS